MEDFLKMEILDMKSRRTSSQADLHFLNVKGNSLAKRKIHIYKYGSA